MKISTNYTAPVYNNYMTFGARKKTSGMPEEKNNGNIILLVGCNNILGNLKVEKMSETEKFGLLKDNLANKVAPALLRSGEDEWNFYINSTPENMQKVQESEDRYYEVYRNKDMYNAFLQIDKTKLSKHDAKILKDILKEFDEVINTGDDLKALNNEENEISQKFNNYVMTIDGKDVSNAEITDILQSETDPEMRKKAYEAKMKRGDLIAEDLRELVNMRNAYAKKQGYNDYFDYKLKETYNVEPEFLDDLLNQVYTKAKSKIKKIQKNDTAELQKFYGTKNLEAYHWGLLLDSHPDKAVNKILKELGKKKPKRVEEISKKTYEGMGYNVDEMLDTGRLTLDLYPRKNKNTHGFCFFIEYGKDARILANLNNNIRSIDTLNHEMGHSVYTLGVPTSLQFFDRKDASPAMTEAIAMMMGDLVRTEDILKDYIPNKNLKGIKKLFSTDECDFITKSSMIIEFEREMYKNPDKDPAQIWKEKKLKYKNRDEKADNEWATIPHFLSHPAYYQNYFRATLMKAQIYNHLKSKFGNITENSKVADYMNKEFFSYGATLDEYDLVEKFTGKPFSADDFVKNL